MAKSKKKPKPKTEKGKASKTLPRSGGDPIAGIKSKKGAKLSDLL
jgi:hypothetical protein